MHTEEAALIRRTDYRQPAFWIRTVDLHIDLDPSTTVVESHMRIERNTAVPYGPLCLDGEDIELLQVLVDGKQADCRLEASTLIVQGVPDGNFTIQIRNTCAPDANTSLSGLYSSGGCLFTQCEAQGFRRITFFLDRPDVMAVYTVTLNADKAKFPVLLSNGNLVSETDLGDGRHMAVWNDPHPKPCYLFAVVAGELVMREQLIRSLSGKEHRLQIYVRPGDLDKTDQAMRSLIATIQWDETRFGLPLDLDRFMIVGVSDFNGGAMENKGLNIFNTAALLASPTTATDEDYARIEYTVAHEYLHNWTGNRITCRDWFQLSLKEGLTVFRHQEFVMDRLGASSAQAVQRIQDVRMLRNLQFPEDSGGMAHPVRPESYREVTNFYTMTVYAKGAEVVRMVQTLLGRTGFEAGLKLYIDRHDGQAVTCDDFTQAMADANPGSPMQARLEDFRRWYSTAGTPHVTARGIYDAEQKTYALQLSQHTRAVSGRAAQAFMIPIAMGLVDERGDAMPLRLRDDAAPANASSDTERVLLLDQRERTFVFEGIATAPVPSLLRGFSAPVTLDDGLADGELLLLLRHDTDAFNRWEAGQRLTLSRMLGAVRAGHPLQLDEAFLDAMKAVLVHPELDPAFKALVLAMPDEGYVAEQVTVVDPQAIHAVVMAARQQLARHLRADLIDAYESHRTDDQYSQDAQRAGRRALSNMALSMLVLDAQAIGDVQWPQRALEQFERASNMTDRLGALAALVNAHAEPAGQALESFYAKHRQDPLVVDKWFALQVSAHESDGRVFARTLALLQHPDFNIRNPNRARSLLGSLFLSNPGAFHRVDGAGYRLWVEQLSAVDAINPHVAARLARGMDRWATLAEPYRSAAHQALLVCAGNTDLSVGVRELVNRMLSSVDE